MASTTLRLSKRVNAEGKSQLKIKLTINRSCRPCFDTECYIQPRFLKTAKANSGDKVVLRFIEPPRLRKNDSKEVKEVARTRTLVNDMANRLTTIAEALNFGESGKVTKESVQEAYWLTRNITVPEITYSLIEILRKNKISLAKRRKDGSKKSFEEYFLEFLDKHKCAERASFQLCQS